MTDPLEEVKIVEVADQLASGMLVGGVGLDAKVHVYAKAAMALVEAGRVVHVATMESVQATRLAAQLTALLPATVTVADRSAGGGPDDDAKVLVGELARLAVDFMWETMQGPVDQPLPPRDVLILDDAVELLHRGGGLEAIASTDAIELLDRMRYAHFIQQYDLVCGTSPYISAQAAEEMTHWYRVAALPGGEPGAREKRGVWPVRRRGPDKAALERWQTDRLGFAQIERDQRRALVVYRRELFDQLSEVSGVEAAVDRWTAAADAAATRSTLARRVADEGSQAVSEYAREVMDRLIPKAWRRHLNALNDLYDGMWGPNGAGGTLGDYADGAHALYTEMLAELHSDFVSYVAPAD